MKERIVIKSWTQAMFPALALSLLAVCGSAFAQSSAEAGKAALIPPPAQEDQQILKRRLQAAKGDVESFRIFAENFRKNGDAKTLAQMQNPVDEFLKKHVDNLLVQNVGHSTLETARLTAEIMFIKTRLLMSMNRNDDARNTVADIQKRFGAYQEISVELPEKTTTLGEALRQLDAELAKTANVK